jgi:A/G-specific adenine glycosylase
MSFEIKLSYPSKKRSLIRKNILDWYDINGRDDLPWKGKDIYKIWISEVMLQQTQVRSVIPYYKVFIDKYPNLESLFKASLDDIMRIWSGLGFYRRAENIHKTSIRIQQEFNGEFPKNYDDVLSLPGIGRTTASAIITFSGNGRYSILDGNVKRFLSRFLSVEMNNSELNSLWELSRYLLSDTRPSDFIQAYMDIGSLVCKKSKPLCNECPVNQQCNSYPYQPPNITNKPKKTKITERNIWSLVIVNNKGQFYLEKISYDNLWKGLYSSPVFHNQSDLMSWTESHKIEEYVESNIWKFTHKLSHIKFTFNTILCNIKYHKKVSLSDDNWYNLSDIDFGIPKYQDKIFNQYKSIYDYN